MRQDLILRFLSKFSSVSINFEHISKVGNRSLGNTIISNTCVKKRLSVWRSAYVCMICLSAIACRESEQGLSHHTQPASSREKQPLTQDQINRNDQGASDDGVDQGQKSTDGGDDQGVNQEQSHTLKEELSKKSGSSQQSESKLKSTEDSEDKTEKAKAKKKTKKKKPQKCRRGINKGKKHCKIERGHISLYHINRGQRHRKLKLIDEERRIIPEAREVLLELLGDWRAKKRCKKGFSFNFEYSGRASWRMYDCYVQDRLLWYLYLIGHHFDSEIHIVSGLRAHERKTSRHHNGHAVDFKVPGVKAKEVWEYCKRTFPLTGIGYYPNTRFVHLDVGRDDHQAFWVDSSGSGESASYKRGVSQEQRGRARKSQAGMIRSIQRNLKRHYKSFKKQRDRYIKRKKQRAERKRKRKNRRAKQRKKKK